MAATKIASATGHAMRASLAALSCLASACAGDRTVSPVVPPPPTPAAVAHIAIPLLPAVLRVGDNVEAFASLTDSAGNELTGRTVAWSSSDTTVARVNDGGVIFAIGQGSATITAASGGVSGSGGLSVYVPVVTSLALTPRADTLFALDVATLSLTAQDQFGRLIVSPSGVTWSSSDSTVAAVNATGLVSALSPGSIIITAAIGGVSAHVAVTVQPVPPPAAIDGDWMMTLSASSSCRENLPAIARDRHYLVHFTQHGVLFDVAISSPTLEVANAGEDHGRLLGTSIGFPFIGDTYYGSWTSTDLVDHLSATETLGFDGQVTGVVADSVINTTMSGDVEYWNGQPSLNGPTVVCRATDHVVTLRRGAGPGT